MPNFQIIGPILNLSNPLGKSGAEDRCLISGSYFHLNKFSFVHTFDRTKCLCMDTKKSLEYDKILSLTFIPLAIAINVGIGAIIKALNVPLYLDSIGTILATILIGWRAGSIVGVLGFALTSIFINPLAIYFCGTQIVIALFTHIVSKIGGFKNSVLTVLTGIGLGVVSAIVSAPIIILVFQGATGNGSALITSFFVKTGHQIIQSVFLSGFSIEPLDKCLQCLLAFFVLKSMPQSLLGRFNTSILNKNNFLTK